MAIRFAGCDLGKASVSFAIISIKETGETHIHDVENIIHGGYPLDVFRKWYTEKDIASCKALCATGLYADQLGDPVHIVPETYCQESALTLFPEIQGQLNLVSAGGAQGFTV